LIKDFFKKFEADMASAAFAEEGMFDVARELSREGKNSGKKVLLGAEGTGADHKAFRYALNLCRRVGADLEILHVLRPSAGGPACDIKEELARTKEALRPVLEAVKGEGVSYFLNFGSGRLEEEVARYVEKRRDILFVVVESPEDAKGKKGGLQKGLAGALERLGCPLVVVSSAVKA